MTDDQRRKTSEDPIQDCYQDNRENDIHVSHSLQHPNKADRVKTSLFDKDVCPSLCTAGSFCCWVSGHNQPQQQELQVYCLQPWIKANS